MSNELLTMGAARIVRALAAREVSSVELTQVLLDRLDVLQGGDIRPMTSIWRDQAILAAESSDERRGRGEPRSRFDGLPMTLKENLDVKGFASTLGVHAKAGVPAERDAVVVHVLREAGCVFLGKTNVSQFLLFHECSNPVFGTTRNPFNSERGPGGSSGGEAAAIAAYGSPGGWGPTSAARSGFPLTSAGLSGSNPRSIASAESAWALRSQGRSSFADKWDPWAGRSMTSSP